jgi:hypothetical protein
VVAVSARNHRIPNQINTNLSIFSLIIQFFPIEFREHNTQFVDMRIEGFDAIETHSGTNFKDENRKAIRATGIKNLPSIGGSDCHNKEQAGRAFTEFENPVHTIDELIEEIKEGKLQRNDPVMDRYWMNAQQLMDSKEQIGTKLKTKKAEPFLTLPFIVSSPLVIPRW